MRKFFILFSFICYCFTVNAQSLKMPPIFGDHMVLQSESNAAIWGIARPNQKIKISASWDNAQSVTTVANNEGKWFTHIQTPQAGGPYSLTVKAEKKITLTNVLVGEVWLASGQSNMEMPLKGLYNQPVYQSASMITDPDQPLIRLFDVKNQARNIPTEQFSGQWTMPSPERIANFSAVAYSFAKKLATTLGTPVGIITSDWGGTRVEAWMDRALLSQKFPEVKLPDENPNKAHYQQPTVLYNGMIHPLIPFEIKGVIWYQGESNRNEPWHYTALFSSMIQQWRKKWNKPELPFYFVQIAPLHYKGGVNSAYLREAQLQTVQETPNTSMICIDDLGRSNCIHPPKKIEVGYRLAYFALNRTYQIKGINTDVPTFDYFETKEKNVIVHFKGAPQGFDNFEKEITGFEVAGEDEVFYPAKAHIVWGKLAVSLRCDKVSKPVAVRYNFKNYCEPSLFNTFGLPISSFRSDQWKVAEILP
ncbi:sialate O-acetylesterase [Persicobacter psychrovividus]|uniref:9-O-acetylesterase n=1 Tax=Persicobacter psychrovividus TaxID=387638 RepID=A0ABN6LGQ8_9BACT|nr:9-O-acetylesterase [Persicobacter psychrovividus]